MSSNTVYLINSLSAIDQQSKPHYKWLASFFDGNDAQTFAESRASALSYTEFVVIVKEGDITHSYRGKKV